ncbi:MAG: gamma-glutamyl-gamma-aminobutyrate hydrolase family protein [Candidatus Hydrogenedentes bacterium]|nr:gamma-glutamyl-gamma-aminobutyrate hydrolase family protein [Candidatus Hydrogenedentota bacterium]
MRIHYVQHVAFEGLGSIEAWAKGKGHTLTATRLFQGEAAPQPSELDWLIVMGGPMGVHDEAMFSWLADEKRAIERVIEAGKPVLGVCLGAQLIADVLGARVYPNAHKEIGWFPIELTAEGQASPYFAHMAPKSEVFHWHGDTFELPAGAVHAAKSEACQNQAFIYKDSVVALQFHMETTPQSAGDLLQHCSDELVHAPYIQSAPEILAEPEQFQEINNAMTGLLTAMEKKAKSV